MIVISPHLDDAVLSCGEAIAATPDITIITVLAGVPDELPVTKFDVDSGFTSGTQAVLGRRREDERAATILDATAVHLDFFDRQYGRTNDYKTIADAIADLLDPGQQVLIPVGIGHPDHETVSRCALAAAKARAARDIVLYEELPYRVLVPEAVGLVLGHRHIKAQLLGLAAGHRREKELAIACYRSQLWAVDAQACMVPERYWRPTWNG